MLACSTPSGGKLDARGSKSLSAEEYAAVFKNLGVKTVIKLNKRAYDAAEFTNRGLKHKNLHLKDGSTPSIDLVNTFIDLALSPGAAAVHCKAGLGRTGTLIGCYAIKIFKIPAEDFIA